jgi:hypothetical protein
MPAGDMPQRERRIVYTFLVEHMSEDAAKLYKSGRRERRQRKSAGGGDVKKATVDKRGFPTTIVAATTIAKAKTLPKHVSTAKRKSTSPHNESNNESNKTRTTIGDSQAASMEVTRTYDHAAQAPLPNVASSSSPVTSSASVRPPASVSVFSSFLPFLFPAHYVAGSADGDQPVHDTSWEEADCLTEASLIRLWLDLGFDPFVTVRCVGGGQSAEIPFSPNTTTVGDLKQMIIGSFRIAADRQLLFAKGNSMTVDTMLLSDYRVDHRTLVLLLPRFVGKVDC